VVVQHWLQAELRVLALHDPVDDQDRDEARRQDDQRDRGVVAHAATPVDA